MKELAFKNVYGYEEVKNELNRVKGWYDNKEFLTNPKITLPKGILLYGQPGCGKTLFAREFIENFDCPKYVIEGESDTSEKMKEAMSDSVHSALTAYSVSPKKAAHICLKNGCYGDVAFVFDENPYVIVILSDMEPGEQENSYLCSVIELADKLHDTLGK